MIQKIIDGNYACEFLGDGERRAFEEAQEFQSRDGAKPWLNDMTSKEKFAIEIKMIFGF